MVMVSYMAPISVIQSSGVLFLMCVLLDFCGHMKYHIVHCSCRWRSRHVFTGASPLLKLSPSGLVPVCSGDQLEVICNTTETFLTWDILWIPDGATTAVNHGGQIINHQSPHDETSCYVIINSVFFNISRISPVNTLPMISIIIPILCK